MPSPHTEEPTMPHRSKPNKRHSIAQFRKGARKTHRKNISVMRGGWRL